VLLLYLIERCPDRSGIADIGRPRRVRRFLRGSVDDYYLIAAGR
jgi:hypothetical protein